MPPLFGTIYNIIYMEFLKESPFSITVCDAEGKLLDMNDMAMNVLAHGQNIIGQNLLDCHPEPARTKLVNMLKEHNINAYTIEKNGQKKLIYQSPWYKDGEFAGYVELSLVLPNEMPHYVRKPKTE